MLSEIEKRPPVSCHTARDAEPEPPRYFTRRSRSRPNFSGTTSLRRNIPQMERTVLVLSGARAGRTRTMDGVLRSVGITHVRTIILDGGVRFGHCSNPVQS